MEYRNRDRDSSEKYLQYSGKNLKAPSKKNGLLTKISRIIITAGIIGLCPYGCKTIDSMDANTDMYQGGSGAPAPSGVSGGTGTGGSG